jgi:Ca2+-binding RTX toxin-like protein
MATLTVGPTSTFVTIAAAMAAAGTGDTILLEAGYSNETATVTVDNLFFGGEASSTNIILQLGPGIVTTTLLGSAPFEARDTADANTIVGNDGDNIFAVAAGVDVVLGGLGIDRLAIDYAAATADITGTPVNVTDGGTHAVTFTGVENFTVTTGSGNDTLTFSDGANIVNSGGGNDTITVGDGVNVIDGGSDNETIIAGNGGNTVVGGLGDDGITTGSGSDIVDAGLGNDTVITGGGTDVITVGGGIDTVDAGTEVDRLIVNYASSTTAVNTGLGGSLAAGYSGIYVDIAGTSSVNFQNVENFLVTSGSGDDIIVTGDGDDGLIGGAGNDLLTAQGGADTLIGGLGADTLDGGVGLDLADYSTSTVGVAVSLTGAPGVGGDATGDLLFNIEGLNGSDFNDALVGDAGANVLSGGSGDDFLLGGAGADTLDGGLGPDTVSYATSASRVFVSLTSGTGLGGDAEGDVLTGVERVVGSTFDDALVGSSGADVLLGGAGDDYFLGGAGADYIDGGDGPDTASYISSSAAISINLTAGTAHGGDAEGDILQNIERLVGTAFNDTLVGSGAGDVLHGSGGNDVLLGSAGADALFGGSGADLFSFEAISDSAVGVALDIIEDFSQAEGDLISLFALTRGGYSFIGAAEFSGGGAAQVRAQSYDANTVLLQLDTGDGAADFQVCVLGVGVGAVGLTATDIIL